MLPVFYLQNEESYFREFMERFVSIWQSQLPLDFAAAECPYWHEVQADQGPHLGRLPDELLPAIGKFIIVASDSCQNVRYLFRNKKWHLNYCTT